MADEPNDKKERTVFQFCQDPKYSYVEGTLTFAKFKAGTCALFKFHQQNLPPNSLKIEIQLFATRLGIYMRGLKYKEAAGAQTKVQAAVTPPANPTQKFLDATNASYTK